MPDSPAHLGRPHLLPDVRRVLGAAIPALVCLPNCCAAVGPAVVPAGADGAIRQSYLIFTILRGLRPSCAGPAGLCEVTRAFGLGPGRDA